LMEGGREVRVVDQNASGPCLCLRRPSLSSVAVPVSLSPPPGLPVPCDPVLICSTSHRIGTLPFLPSPSAYFSLHSFHFIPFQPSSHSHTHTSCSGHSHQQGLLLPSDSSLDCRPAPSSSLPAHSTPRTLPPLPRPKVHMPPPFRTKADSSIGRSKKTDTFHCSGWLITQHK